MSSNGERYRFGDFELDCATLELCRAGEVIALEPRALDVLVYLVRQRDRVVSRDELVDAVWPGSFISDSALGQSVLKARRAVDDDGRRQEVIRTVHGRGFRFVADVALLPANATDRAAHRLPAPAPRTLRRPRRRVAAGAGAVVLIALAVGAWLALKPAAPVTRPRIALLPFVNQTGDPTLAWIEAGLPRLLARTLSGNDGIEAIADSSLGTALERAGAPRDGSLDPKGFEALRRNFGATHAVTATISRDGELFRLALGIWQGERRPRRIELAAPRMPEVLDAALRTIGERVVGASETLPTRAGFSDDPFVNRLYAMGLAEYGRDNYRGAESYFRVCLDREPDLHWARYETALCVRRLGDWEESLRVSEEVLAAALKTDDWRLQAAVHNNMGITLWRQGNTDEAEQHYLAASAIAAARTMRDVQASAMLSLGILASDRGDFDRAESFQRQALAIYREMADASGEASALNSLGVLAWHRGDLATSREMHERALLIRRNLGMHEREAASLNNLGTIAQATGRWDEAHDLFSRALSIRRELDDRVGQASTLYNLSSLELLRAQPESSRSLAEEALELARELGDRRRIAWSLGQLSEIAAGTGDHQTARVRSEEALALYREIDDRHAEAKQLIDLGHLALADGDTARAVALCDQGRSIANELGDRRLEGLESHLRGAIAARTGRSDDAVALLERALTVAREVGHDAQGVAAAIALGNVLLDNGEVEKARALAGDLTSFAGGNYPPAQLVLARLRAAEGRSAEALALAEAARQASGPLWTADDQAVLDGLADPAAGR